MSLLMSAALVAFSISVVVMHLRVASIASSQRELKRDIEGILQDAREFSRLSPRFRRDDEYDSWSSTGPTNFVYSRDP
jgi:hypothetical protein